MDKPKSRRPFGNKHKDFSTSDFYRNNSWKKNKNNENTNTNTHKSKIDLNQEYQFLTSNSFSWIKNTFNI